jgi:predicted nucleic acid-binding protein
MTPRRIAELLLVDSGPLYAATARRDTNHRRCAALLREHAAGPLVVPALVVTEVAYLIGDRLGAQAECAFAAALRAGELQIEAVAASDWDRIAELCEQYADLPLGIVDASVIATAERLGLTAIATLDRRHFGTVRPRHVDAFRLLP